MLLFVIHFSTFASMARVWLHSNTFAHGMLIFPICGWLVWRRRHRLAELTPAFDWRGLPLVAALSFLWLTADLAGLMVGTHLTAVAMIPALVWTLGGWVAVRELAFPLAFLFFAVPAGEGLIPWLMDITADITVFGLKWTGIPVLREGNYFSIPSGDFEVARACSGIRYLIASVAVGSLFAYLMFRSIWKRLIFFLVSIGLPIIANGIRAYGIVMIAHLSDLRLALGVDHIVAGWVFFGIVIALLFWVGLFFRDPEPATSGQMEPNQIAGSPRRSGRQYVGLFLTLGAIGLGPIAAKALSGWDEQQLQVFDPALPIPSSPWLYEGDVTGSWRPEFRQPSFELAGRYARVGEPAVEVHLLKYVSQRQGTELAASYNTLVPDPWRQIRQGRAENLGLPVRRLELVSGSERILLWYWFDVSGRTVDTPARVKLVEITQMFRRDLRGSALIAVATPADAGARDRLRDFVHAHAEQLHGCLFGSKSGCMELPR